MGIEMLGKVNQYSRTLWRWFRGLPPLMQALIAVPFFCGMMLSILVGNMGLALLGGAVALSSWAVGATLGVIGVVFAKAISIIIRDRRNR